MVMVMALFDDFPRAQRKKRDCIYSFCSNKKINLPFNAMRGSENISVIDEHASAVEPLEVGQASHPGELVNTSLLAPHNSGYLVPFAAFWNHGQGNI